MEVSLEISGANQVCLLLVMYRVSARKKLVGGTKKFFGGSGNNPPDEF
jgi:hypothetical protein